MSFSVCNLLRHYPVDARFPEFCTKKAGGLGTGPPAHHDESSLTTDEASTAAEVAVADLDESLTTQFPSSRALNPKNPVWANAGAASNNGIPGWEPLVPARERLRRTLDWFAGRSSRTEASPARR